VDTYTISCDVSNTRRQEIMESFCENDYTKIKIIANVRILDEAIDLVPCDCVFITKVCSNEITTVQRLGRALRKDKNNPSKHAAMFIWCEDWEDCVQSLQLLKQEDVEFNSKIRIIGKDYVKTKESIVLVNAYEKAFIKFVEIKCLSLTAIWEMRRQLWVTQYATKGNKNPSEHSKDIEEKRAGSWQSKMRQCYKKGKLSPERTCALNDTTGWEWGDVTKIFVKLTFEENLKLWVIEYGKKGNKPPSQNSKDLEEKRAGQWQKWNCKHYKKGKLAPERSCALDNTPGWEWGDVTKIIVKLTFEENLKLWVTEYAKKGNKPPSMISKDLEEKRAGKWQSNMRCVYKKGKLSPERTCALNDTNSWKWAR
jgi:hypothetical protein